MELVKNKASGKYFVVLDDTESDKFLVITSEGKVKHLERYLFGPRITAELKSPPLDFNLTKTQMDKCEEYLND